ncbi:MAG TPA: ABC transporter ATP-binding protein [Acidimicrobiia bacterium]|nr:ABC transporter ATP-binding protein [Acidimicrobiia bacterium]
MSAVRVEGLTKVYGHVTAVDGIDFEIETGEVVAVLGPNGAGKTTTVEMIEGYRRPDRGHIEVLGRDPSRREGDWLDRIGIVLQHSGIEDELTVSEAIVTQARAYSSPMGVEEAIEMVDLGEKRDDRIKTLSGGQRRRLDLALAMVGNPELLFLDEPTTGFDPAARRRSWEAIRALAGAGTTVVLTTHYLEEAQALADRVIVMSRGSIVASGPPDDLGDRSTGSTTIRFKVDPARANDLGVGANGGAVVIETDDPVPMINRITGDALRLGIAIEGLELTRPTLEEAYLRLVGGRDE